jgi:hypothetical protein
MNKINPVFLLFATIVIFLISIFQLNTIKNEFIKEQNNFNEYKLIALQYHSKNNIYSNTKSIINRLNRILKITNIKNANIKQTSKGITLNIQNTDTKHIDKVVNKLLNEEFNIKRLKITNNSIFVEVEII